MTNGPRGVMKSVPPAVAGGCFDCCCDRASWHGQRRHPPATAGGADFIATEVDLMPDLELLIGDAGNRRFWHFLTALCYHLRKATIVRRRQLASGPGALLFTIYDSRFSRL